MQSHSVLRDTIPSTTCEGDDYAPAVPDQPGKRKRTLFAALAIGGSTLLALLLAELALAAWFPLHHADMAAAYQYDEELGVRVKPNLRWADSTDHYRELRTNAKGTVNLQESFGDYRHLVFAIGDSYTEGIGVAMDSAYPFQLDLILNLSESGYRKDFGVVNLGLAGYGIQQAVITARRYADVIGRPEIIVFVGAHNDPRDDLGFASSGSQLYHVDGNPHVTVPPWLVQAVASTQLGRRLKRALSPSRGRRAEVEKKLEKTRRNPVTLPGWSDLQEEYLDALKLTAADLKATLIVSFAGDGVDYDSLRNWAKREQVPFADWRPRAESVRAALPELPERNAHSGGHLRPWIYRLMAEEIATEIRRVGGLEAHR